MRCNGPQSRPPRDTSYTNVRKKITENTTIAQMKNNVVWVTM